jgi:hypothetical protein
LVFSGNYWWADCEHVSALPPLVDRFNAYTAEFFVFNVTSFRGLSKFFGQHCGYSTFKCHGVNHYDHECAFDVYRPKLLEYVTSEALPVSEFSTMKKPLSEVLSACSSMKHVPYLNQIGWSHWEQFPLQVLERSMKTLFYVSKACQPQ